MKKRFSFLAPMTVALSGLLAAALPATANNAVAPAEVPQIASAQDAGDRAADALVLKRSADTRVQTAEHYSHSSHVSHASHASHYSSR